PGTDSPLEPGDRILLKGTTVSLIHPVQKKRENGITWLKVKSGNHQGYVAANWLRHEKKAISRLAANPPTPPVRSTARIAAQSESIADAPSPPAPSTVGPAKVNAEKFPECSWPLSGSKGTNDLATVNKMAKQFLNIDDPEKISLKAGKNPSQTLP